MSQLKVNSIVPTGGLPSGATSGGIIQIVEAVKTDLFSASISIGNYSQITGLAVTITPSTNTSKIILHAVVNFCTSGDNVHTAFEIRNGSTRLTGYQNTGSLGNFTPSMTSSRNETTSAMVCVPIHGVDSPASTSAQTYNVFASAEGYTLYINKAQSASADQAQNYGTISTLTAYEVGV